ncbi:MAG: DUF2889 domain-containing protein, partial [Phycisphaeraceae bacterium]|nr:DUF2889 domain-containing protein [Phycisphaeraceae bacterium]
MSERTPYQPYGTAIYRREMNVHATDDGALGELVDDFHHFRARVKCDGDRVLEVVAESLRPPWSTCVEAERLLEHLEGMPLAPSLRAAGQYTPSRMQCTHMFDAAALAIARLGSGTGGVTYSIAIPDRVDGRTHATIERDGELLLEWDLVKNEIVGSEPFSGQQIVGHQFAAWAEASLDRDR